MKKGLILLALLAFAAAGCSRNMDNSGNSATGQNAAATQDPHIPKAEKVVSDFLMARKNHDLQLAESYLEPQLRTTADALEIIGVSKDNAGPKLASFEIVSSKYLPEGAECLTRASVHYNYGGNAMHTEDNFFYVNCDDTAPANVIDQFPYMPPTDFSALRPVKVYFVKAGDTAGPQQTEPVIRYLAATNNIPATTLEVLLRGPSDAELSNGYSSNIPEGSKINSFKIVNGTAIIDFNNQAQAGGGSLSEAGRITQIVQTLLQFPEIHKIKISINGISDPSKIFQP